MDRRRVKRGGGWVTLAWGLPGFVWLGFYLVAPLVFIVLVSFWTRTDTGFVRHWTGANYHDLLHPFNLDNSYWKNMETSFLTSVIAVVGHKNSGPSKAASSAVLLLAEW